MSRQAFEYHAEFAPLHYLVRTKKLLMFTSEKPTTEPDVQGFLRNPDHGQLFAVFSLTCVHFIKTLTAW